MGMARINISVSSAAAPPTLPVPVPLSRGGGGGTGGGGGIGGQPPSGPAGACGNDVFVGATAPVSVLPAMCAEWFITQG